MSALTVPGVCLDLLQWRATCCMVAFRAAEDGAFAMGHSTELPIDWEPGDRVLVAQSEGALLRVLARHLGWQGNQRPVLRVERRGRAGAPAWVLRSLTKWHDTPYHADDGPNFYAKLPAHISTDLTYHEALGAAACWYARLERVRAGSDATVVLGADPHADLAAIEKSFELPEWRVEVTTL